MQSQEWGFGRDKDFTLRLSKNSALHSFIHGSFRSSPPFFSTVCQQIPGATSLGSLTMPVLLNQRGQLPSLGIGLLIFHPALLYSTSSGLWNSLGLCQLSVSKMAFGCSMCLMGSGKLQETGFPPLYWVIQQYPSRFQTVQCTSVLWHMASSFASCCKSPLWARVQPSCLQFWVFEITPLK